MILQIQFGRVVLWEGICHGIMVRWRWRGAALVLRHSVMRLSCICIGKQKRKTKIQNVGKAFMLQLKDKQLRIMEEPRDDVRVQME